MIVAYWWGFTYNDVVPECYIIPMMSLINHRRRSAIWHGASQKVGQSATPLFLDRIDIQCEITPVPFKDISQAAPGEPSATIRERVIAARQIQEQRYNDIKGIHCNAPMTERMIHQYAEPDADSVEVLRSAMERLSLSARAYSRILKVARTIADLDGSEKVQLPHIAEAIGYRQLDRGDWAERGMYS